MRTVRDLLETKGRKVWSIAPNEPVFEAIRVMAEAGIGALLAMEGDRLVGIVSERDYARKVILAGKSSKETAVREIMTPNVVCCSLETSVEAGMSIMTERHIRHLPVLDGSRVAGVISIGDLVKAVINDQKFVIDQLERYVAG